MKKIERQNIEMYLLLNEFIVADEAKKKEEVRIKVLKKDVTSLMEETQQDEVFVEQSENSENKKIKALRYDRVSYEFDTENLYKKLRKKLTNKDLKKIFELKINKEELENLIAMGELTLKDINDYTTTKSQKILKIMKVNN